MDSENLDEKLIKAYMGDKADKMYDNVKKGGLDIWAMLWGQLYYVYRKMYLVTFLTIIGTSIITSILPGIQKYLWIVIGGMFTPLYKWDITRKLRKIKENNPNASEEELIEKARNAGGVVIVPTIIYAIIILISVILSVNNI